MRINDEVDTNKDELLDERQSTAQKPKRDRNMVLEKQLFWSNKGLELLPRLVFK